MDGDVFSVGTLEGDGSRVEMMSGEQSRRDERDGCSGVDNELEFGWSDAGCDFYEWQARCRGSGLPLQFSDGCWAAALARTGELEREAGRELDSMRRCAGLFGHWHHGRHVLAPVPK